MNAHPGPEENKKKPAPPARPGTDTALNSEIRKQEKEADKKWEKVKDNTSGVNKELEKKFKEGSVDPEDLNTQGG